MEDLEKEKCSCGCCPECTCGDDCHCGEEGKCCDECTCDTNCNCHNGDNCKCEEDCKCNENEDCKCNDECICGNNCECDIDNKCSENCACGENLDNNCQGADNCDCDKNSNCDEERECDTLKDDTTNPETDDDKCKCGCGESVTEDSTADAYFKQLLSLRAEFDNYRKRSQGDIAKAYSNGFNQAITEFLPALDSFKMATEYITDANTLMGIQYIEKGILSTLEKMGIEVIDATGKFNPDFHQAIGSEVSLEHESGDIIKECFKGFKMGDKVIRYAQVIVAK